MGSSVDAPDSIIADNAVQNSHSLLPKIQQQILKQIGFNPVSIDTIITRSGLSTAEINANLVLLEVNDYIQSHPGGHVSLKSN